MPSFGHILVLVFVVPALALAAADCVVTDGLVLNYDFAAGSMPHRAGVIRDLSGNGIHAVIRPASLTYRTTGWQAHEIKQGDGRDGWLLRPARIQVLKRPQGRSTIPKPFEPVMQQIAYVVRNGSGRFYRDGVPFSIQRVGGKAGQESLFKFCVNKAGGKDTLRLAIGAYPRADHAGSVPMARLAGVRIYSRALTVEELGRNLSVLCGSGVTEARLKE